MEIKYAYEMTRKAEEVRKEIQAKNNALRGRSSKTTSCQKLSMWQEREKHFTSVLLLR